MNKQSSGWRTPIETAKRWLNAPNGDNSLGSMAPEATTND